MDAEASSSQENEFFIHPYKDGGSYSQDALRSILTATKAAAELPAAGDDYDYYSEFPVFQKALMQQKQKCLNLMTSLIHSHSVRESFHDKAVDEQFDLLVDANDTIFESASNCLDEAAGLRKSQDELVVTMRPNAINTSWNKKSFSSVKLLTARCVSRPQLTFKTPPDNSKAPFLPILKEKPNSIKPLAITLEMNGDREEYCHPYEWEIEKFEPAEELLQEVEPTISKSLEETPLEFVKTVEQLQNMSSDLRSQKEIAIDLEHHSYRSFLGFTCLMQISTRQKDYIVDTLELRSELHILNEVFTDPKIVKVLHGANSDILWLQRDFGLYVVNLFDTGQAARVLHFAHLSLSFLLKHYCKLEVDKQFQLADWRIRPLPTAMLKYAREDTHYLLYIYDCMKNDLIKTANGQKNLLVSAFHLSKIICAKKYEKPWFHEEKYAELFKKSKKLLNGKQLYCFKELYSWRDRMARLNDESLAYVLPDHMMFQIAEALPREQQGILACCNPIPPLVKQQLNELHTIILKTNETSLKQLESLDLQRRSVSQVQYYHLDLTSLTHCPHDIHHLEDPNNVSGAPLISPDDLENRKSILKEKSILFHSKPQSASLQENTEAVTNLMKKLISPFERFKVTEGLHVNKKTDEQAVVETPQAPTETNEKGDQECQIVEEVQEDDDASSPVVSSTPIRVKSKKKRKKKLVPDVSLICTDTPPSKKSCTPENFKPYDYSVVAPQTDKGNTKGDKQKRNQNSKPEHKKFFSKKRKHVKQATFGDSGSSSWSKKK